MKDKLNQLVKNITKEDKNIHFEQYFTKCHVARDSIQMMLDDIKNHFKLNVFEKNKIHFIEPSCGEGIFVKEIKKINSNIIITCLDIDNLYSEAIVCNFLKTDKKKLNIKIDEFTVFFGCPPSDCTKKFLEHCKKIDRESKIYFILEEKKIEECIKEQVFVSYSILKNYGRNVFLFKKNQFTTQGAYLLVRATF